jgi:GT2 family glycosyltransferase
MSPPFASIIIPTRNRPADLHECLMRLFAQLPSEGSVEILVCDDGDDSDTAELLKREFPAVARHDGPRNGPGANRNVGANHARGEWLIFLDDDCLPHAKLLETYLETMKTLGAETQVVLAGPIYRTDPHKDSLLWEAPHNAREHHLPPSCNFAIRRAMFLHAGGFDERFRISFEDIELFARLGVMGVPVRFEPEAAVDHPSRPLPPADKLAWRWEARVISSFDFGATSSQIFRLLPRHVILVILSRFRDRKLDSETFAAAGKFFAEFLATLGHLPGWVGKYQSAPRSPFWIEQVKKGNGPPRFGL